MNQFLFFLHLVGLMLGAAGGFASGMVMRRAATMSEGEARTVRSLGPMLANLSATGLVLLWITGLLMVWSKWGGFANLPALFWVKFLFVLVLTASVGFIHATYARVRRGDLAAASRLPKLGPVAGVSTLLVVLFAVYTFRF